MNYSELVRALRALDLTVFTAESCTGGLIAKKITDIPGASEVLNGGIVSYTDRIKEKLLGVKPETIENHTAVSAETAAEMAAGAARYADIGISVTGYASEWNGCEVGLVYIGISFGGRTAVKENRFSGTRDEIRNAAADTAAELIMKMISSVPV